MSTQNEIQGLKQAEETRKELRTLADHNLCFVCEEKILEDDLWSYKYLNHNDFINKRHYWHIAPNHDFVQGMVRYTNDLVKAAWWAYEKMHDPYKAPEQKEMFRMMWDEAHRLIAKKKKEEQLPYY